MKAFPVILDFMRHVNELLAIHASSVVDTAIVLHIAVFWASVCEQQLAPDRFGDDIADVMNECNLLLVHIVDTIYESAIEAVGASDDASAIEVLIAKSLRRFPRIQSDEFDSLVENRFRPLTFDVGLPTVMRMDVQMAKL
jgi:hypothetical protein